MHKFALMRGTPGPRCSATFHFLVELADLASLSDIDWRNERNQKRERDEGKPQMISRTGGKCTGRLLLSVHIYQRSGKIIHVWQGPPPDRLPKVPPFVECQQQQSIDSSFIIVRTINRNSSWSYIRSPSNLSPVSPPQITYQIQDAWCTSRCRREVEGCLQGPLQEQEEASCNDN